MMTSTFLWPRLTIWVTNSRLVIVSKYGYRRDNTVTVRLNTMARDRIDLSQRMPAEVKDLFCKSNLGEMTRAKFYHVDGPPVCPWKNYFLDCVFKEPVQQVELIDENNNTSMTVRFTYKLNNF